MVELIYSIDSIRSTKDNALTIKIQLAEKVGFLLKAIDSQKAITWDLIKKTASSKETALLDFLLAEETDYIKKVLNKRFDRNSALFDYFHLSNSAIPQAFKLFAISGKLFFKEKPLTIDLFGKTELYYLVDTKKSPPFIEAIIKTSSSEFPLHSCDYIGKGPSHWFIKGIILKTISTDISWKNLKLAYEQVNRPVDELLLEAEEDDEAPRVISNGLINSIKQDPLPILMLKDRLGSFANLIMDYGNNKKYPYELSFSKTNLDRVIVSEEGWEKDLLETDYIKKTMETSHYYCPLDKVAKSILFLLEIGWKVHDWKGNTILQPGEVTLCGDILEGAITIKGKIQYEAYEADVTDIIGAFNKRERFAQIASGFVALIPTSLEKGGIDILAEEGEIIGKSILMRKNAIGSLSNLFENHPSFILESNLSFLKDKVESFKKIAHSPPGDSFCGCLRPYQQEGLNWLKFLYDFGFHGMLADDMGLGKTVQVLAFLSQIAFKQPILIVVPTSLLFNWKKEIEKFLPSYSYIIHHGNKRAKELHEAQIVITTYATLRLDFALLGSLHYSCLIVDEAQAIKNANTQTFQAVAKIRSDFRLSITGTPIENHLLELWSHFHFLMPDLLGDQATFNAELQAGTSDSRFLKRIKKKIRPFLLRRQKEEVAKDLPEKIEQTVWIEMGEEQRIIYERFLSGIRQNLITKVNEEGLSKHRMEVLEAIMRLRQICCHPLLVQTSSESDLESAKLDALMEDLETAISENRKVLVYSQFTTMLTLISRRVKEKGWGFVYLDGSTQNREKVVTQFQEDPNTLLFLISLKAGGVGLNLTAADYVLLYDPWWNNAIENQAIDRAHRIGRKDTVIAKRYIVAESIEEKMMKLKAAKSSLAAEILDDEETVSNLTGDDLLFLLS